MGFERWNHWTVGLKLATGVGALLATVGIAAAVAGWGVTSVKGSQEQTYAAARRMQLATQLNSLNAQLIGSEKALIIAGATNDDEMRKAWHKKVEKELASAHEHIDSLRTMAANDAERQVAAKLAASIDQWSKGCAGCHDEKADIANIGSIKKLSAKTEQLAADNEALTQTLEHDQTEAFSAESDAAGVTFSRARLMMAVTVGLALLIGAIVGYVVRDANRRLRHMAHALSLDVERVLSAASQLSISSQSLSEGSVRQAASLEETSASAEELAAMTRQNAENSQQAATLTVDAAARVLESTGAIDAMQASMQRIRSSSEKITQIIKTIDGIAFQTNLLALNAAVEAARAGDAGKGFAVVADEVRALAQRSASAARETTTLIEESLSHVRDGGQRMQQVTASIAVIADSVRHVKKLVEEVSGASREQSHGIAQVSQAVAEMEKVTQSAAAAAEETAASSDELRSQAQSTTTLVEELERLVGGIDESAAGLKAQNARAVQRRSMMRTVEAVQQPDERRYLRA